ncbi:MAG TPA: hypothetical protein VKE88_01490 [Candidatus Nanoarchaeia archaeon]|nr:hypothetical protein [Candidatus Nanoarchaeia archaeon]
MLEGKVNELFELVAKNADELKERFMKDVCDNYVLVFAQDSEASKSYIGHAIAMDGSNNLHLFGNVTQLTPTYKSTLAFPEFVIPRRMIGDVYVMKPLKSSILDVEKAQGAHLPAAKAS